MPNNYASIREIAIIFFIRKVGMPSTLYGQPDEFLSEQLLAVRYAHLVNTGSNIGNIQREFVIVGN